jgi:hypothetical protein
MSDHRGQPILPPMSAARYSVASWQASDHRVNVKNS